MNRWHFIAITILICTLENGAILADDGDVIAQGLYGQSDNVEILTSHNFENKVYGKQYVHLVQFYNSYCGDCRQFQPKFSRLATEMKPWENIIRLAVLDCSEEDNNDKCREFEVEEYPSLRYFHEHFVKSLGNNGDKIKNPTTAQMLKTSIIRKMQAEQRKGRLGFAPSLLMNHLPTYEAAIAMQPDDVLYTFLVFENERSTVGSELALDMNDYSQVTVKRVSDICELALIAGLKNNPGIAVVTHTKAQIMPVTNPTKENILRAINTFLESENYPIPIRKKYLTNSNYTVNPIHVIKDDVVFYGDLEKTLRTTLHLEVVRRKVLKDESLQALLYYLDVLVRNYPFRTYGNLKVYLQHLNNVLRTRNKWSGDEVYKMVKDLEAKYAPVYTTNVDYVACKGSQPKYRGFPCGLWTLFHALTVNAINQPGTEGPKVLRGMHGYIRNFFGCSGCSRHFQQMSARNHIFRVQDNDNALMWLWSSHNEVNKRLAGDMTEDPVYPKKQFPVVSRCPECVDTRGVWNTPTVFQHLNSMYGAKNIKDVSRLAHEDETAVSLCTNLIVGLLDFFKAIIKAIF